ncbi:DUF4253 domain-containing protein [Streptomyces sp. CA-210063]|uniref:DUF4253 domain-containing protein n=1 Tax=Streptomyces sp. CA-210063 TaxID=2801029 RepID=UPI00214C7FEE|nr:DUF4253 domain-containing protein [Streptomyces sp. CA-210063]UUU31725.1 DUF4253 domain-containing protein [Streptomyces sp. CA-210063]
MSTLPNPLSRLTADPTGHAFGLELPPGGLLYATDTESRHDPLLWRADAPARPGDWPRLAAARHTAGLRPLLVATGGSAHEDGPEQWYLAPHLASHPRDHDAEGILAAYWEDNAWEDLDEDDEAEPFEAAEGGAGPGPGSSDPDPDPDLLGPFGHAWPGLATAAPLDADPDARAAEIADSLLHDGSWLKRPRMALVPASRSADIPAAIGWTGPVNYETDVARLCTVLRSWEDRFGIRVIALTLDQLVLSVAAPPTTRAEAEAVAAEHFAFCPDTLRQTYDDGLRAYAEKELLGQHLWAFWWD